MRQFHFDFTCFFDFLDRIFLDGFSKPFIVRSRSSFLFSQWKFFELYVRTWPAMFFYFVVTIFVTTIWRHNHFKSSWHLWRFRVDNSWSSWLVITMGNFFLRFVSGILPAMFFLISVHTFSWFLKPYLSSDFGHAETGSGAKKRVVSRRKFSL